jgi:UPF0176 protein
MLHSAFYRFMHVADPWATANAVRVCAAGLTGSIVVAAEGISGAVAGAPPTLERFEANLQAHVLRQPLRFNHSACTTPPFGRLKVSVKPELVALGLPDRSHRSPRGEPDATHLSPQAWFDRLQRPDVVVLDNRNHFEYRLGHFQGAVDPGVHNFRDLSTYVLAHAPAWRDAGKPVAMYCTGGIRCEKAAPWLQSLGLNVVQLEGGILNYLQTMPHATPLWQGECFVFDNRVALGPDLQETQTTAAQVFEARHPDEAWRLRRAQQLDRAPKTSRDSDGTPCT